MRNIINKEVLILAAVLCFLFCGLAGAGSEESGEFFSFGELASLPVNLEKPFIGRHAKSLLVIGGFRQEDSQMLPNSSVYTLAAGDQQWTELPGADKHIYGGASVSTLKGLICVGGYEDDQLTKKVTRFVIEDGQVKSEALVDMPVAVGDAKAAVVSNILYVVGSEGLFSLDLLSAQAKWKQLPGFSEKKEAKVLFAAGVAGKLYVFSRENLEGDGNGYNVLRLSKDNQFEKIGSTDYDLASTLSAPCGQGHVVFVSKTGQSDDILGYHTITNKWFVMGNLPQTVKPVGIVFDDLEFDIIGTDAAVNVKAIAPSTKYGWVDHGVVAVFMVGMLLIGAYLSKREKNSEDFFRGGKRIPWWASGLSLFATGASAISLMAMPGKAFATNWVYMTVSFYTVVTLLPLSIYVYMPIARRLKVATANEYLERRFNIFLRVGGSIIWSILQILGRMATIMLLPAIAISSITGISIEASIIIMGVVTTIYVFLGGLEGVIWTDVLQAIVMIVAVVICAAWALFSLDMNAGEAWANLQSTQKLHMFDWQMSFVEPCVMILFLNMFITSLGQIGDQNFIQRVQCTPNEKDAKKAVITQVAVAVPLNGLLFGLGTILFLFYMEKPEMLSPAIKSDGIFPLFAAQNLPAGLAGLVIAAILAATMSTLSSAINSVANLGVEDFYRRFSKNPTDHRCLILGRVLTVGLGVFGTFAALYLANTDLMSIWDLYFVILGMLLGAITGVYTLGIFTRKANSIGVIIGAIASLGATFYVRYYTHIHFLAYPIVGVVACYVVGYVSSLIIPSKQKDITGLTVYTLQKKSE
jgi:SSS family transporter